MRIAIVDDDPAAREELAALLTARLPGTVPALFPDGESFLAAFAPGDYDLVLLDIFMGGCTGVDVARQVRTVDDRVRLVFCTTSNGFASESYQVGATDYLQKPFDEQRVQAMLRRVDPQLLEQQRTVTLPDGQQVRLSAVVYADYAEHRVTLHLTDGSAVRQRCAFARIQELLCGSGRFFSPCKGVVVNFEQVAARQTAQDTFVLTDGTVVPISRRRQKAVVEAYAAFCFQRLRREATE